MKKNKVIIIRPTAEKFSVRGEILHIPLGPLYLSRVLIDKGYKVNIVDTDNQDALKQVDQLFDQDLICFAISTMSGTQLANAAYLAKELKKKYPDISLVWGGVHVTALPEETLKSDLVDFIVWGEGEDVFPILLEAIKNNDIESLHGQKGIGFKIKGQLSVGENSGYVSLDKTFDLPYELLNINRYTRKLIIGGKKEISIWSSRGCPYRCGFCSNASQVWPNTKVRYHTLDHVVNDVKRLVTQYGIDFITFGDEIFLLDEKRLVKMLKAIYDAGIRVKYRFLARIDSLLRVSDQSWEIFKEHNVSAIISAPESGSQKILDYMQKNITLEQIYKADQLLTKHGFFKSYNILICTPRETIDDFKMSLKLILDLTKTSQYCPFPFSLNTYIPLPGTKLYQDAINLGFKPPSKLEDWGKFDFDDIAGSKHIVRPWIKDEDFSFIQKASELVNSLNLELKGKDVDQSKISSLIKQIEELIEKDYISEEAFA